MFTIPEAQVDFEAVSEKFNEIIDFIKSSTDKGQAVHEVEQRVWEHLLQMGRQAMQIFFL